MDEAGNENGVSRSGKDQVDLSLLMDFPLQVTVELGRARLTIEDLLNPDSAVGK